MSYKSISSEISELVCGKEHWDKRPIAPFDTSSFELQLLKQFLNILRFLLSSW